MTEIVEGVAIGFVTEFETKCPFDHNEKHKCPNIKNDFEGDSSKLGKNLDSGKVSTIVDGHPVMKKADKDKKQENDPDEAFSDAKRVIYTFTNAPPHKYLVGFAAHHLIPAEASMNKATDLKKYMCDDGLVCCNIGYDVNGGENGVWLPGLHAVNANGLNLWTAGPKATTFPDKEGKGRKPVVRENIDYQPLNDKNDLRWHENNPRWRYVKESIHFLSNNPQGDKKAGTYSRGVRQFHDAHPKYSSQVLEKLKVISDHLNAKVGGKVNVACPDCSKKLNEENKKLKPAYALLERLNMLSEALCSQLTGTECHKLWYTSTWGNKTVMDAWKKDHP